MVDAFLAGSEHYKKGGPAHKLGFLLYGKPGCGKTRLPLHFWIRQFSDFKALLKHSLTTHNATSLISTWASLLKTVNCGMPFSKKIL